MMLLALGLCFSAFVALSLATEKHPLAMQGRALVATVDRRAWRWVGWALLGVAFALSVTARGWALGPVLWLGEMTVAGIALAFGLYPYRPRWIVPAACLVPLASVAGLLL